MTTLAHRTRVRAAGRLVLLVVAIALTTWGVYLIAFADTVRGARLGIPIAFWGVLAGYTAIRVSSDGVAGADPEVAAAPSSALATRAPAELVAAHDEAIRHGYELQLEVMLRRELEQVLRTELTGLRRDVAELRETVLDAVDGRLQMERVEITRIVGSNLAARHDDGRSSVRAAADVVLDTPGASLEPGPGHTWSPVPARPGSDGAVPDNGAVFTDGTVRTDDAALNNSARSGPAQTPVATTGALGPGSVTPTSDPRVPSGPSSPSLWSPGVPFRRAGSLPVPPPATIRHPSPNVEAEPLTESAATPSPATQADPNGNPEPTTSHSSDPFASLPRLSVFRLPELPAGVALARPEPLEPEPLEQPPTAGVSGDPATTNGYVGRRRHAAGPAGPAGTDASVDTPTDLAAGEGFEDAGAEDESVDPPSGRHGAGAGTTSSPVRRSGPDPQARPIAHPR